MEGGEIVVTILGSWKEVLALCWFVEKTFHSSEIFGFFRIRKTMPDDYS